MFIVDFKIPVIKLEKTDYDITELSKQINTTPEEIIHKPSWFMIDGKWYYFKGMEKLERFINEILGSFLSKKYNLPTVDYKVASFDNGRYTIYGLISENFKLQNKSYSTTYDLKLPVYEQGLSNIVMIREYFKNEDDYYKFIVSILKATAIDFYMNQIDRVNENLLFVKEEDKIELAPLFDFSLAMDIGRKSVCAHFDDIAGCYTYFYKENDKREKKKFGSAFLELTFPSPELKRLFRDYPEFYETFKSLIEFDMHEFIDYVEDSYPIVLPNYLKEHYMGYNKEKTSFMKKLIWQMNTFVLV